MATFPVPPVLPMPGGNQYGGQPINPFAGPGPTRPLMAPGILPPKPAAGPASDFGFYRPVMTPTQIKATDAFANHQLVPISADAPPPQVITPAQISQTKTASTSGPLLGATPAVGSIQTPAALTAGKSFSDLAPLLNTTNGVIQNPSGLTGSFSGAGPLLGATAPPASAPTTNTPFSPRGGVISDIQKKDNIVAVEPNFTEAQLKNPFIAGIKSAYAMKAAYNQAHPSAAPVAAVDTPQVSPMTGLGAQPVPVDYAVQQGWQPAGPQQYTPNIPQIQLYQDPDKPGSDERMKYVSSPIEAKKDIRPVDVMVAPQEYQDAWKGVSMQQAMQPPQAAPSFSAPPIVPGRGAGFKEVIGPPAVDLRPAVGYSYNYKDPNAEGAKPGVQVGPMAQHLEKTFPGATVVSTNPNTGMKQVDTNRLTMVNTAAISEQQRKLDELTALLDDAYARSAGDTGSRYGRF